MILYPLIIVLCYASTINAQINGPIIDIESGPIQGKIVATHYGINVHSFNGIPFGAPPIGDLRFERPQPVAPWDEVFQAFDLGKQCMQSEEGILWITHPGFGTVFGEYSEDCLNLDVVAPENLTPAEPYPVMVYFFGGGFNSGGNIQYPGHFIAARDVVVVTVNYRVAIFGFINTEDDTNPGNTGLYDQALALQWVQENIAYFGGNPDRVTIFGQSAGAASTGIHTVSPVTDGLFHAAIEESGTDTNFWSYNRPVSMPWTYPQQAAEKVGCPIEPPIDMYECLKTIDANVLEDNDGVTCTPGYYCLGHAPVIDGPGNFLPDDPLRLREAGQYSQVPLMSGWNAEDGSLYLIAYMPEALEGGFNRSEFNFLLYDRYIRIWNASVTPQQAEDAYWAVNFFYSPWPYINDEDLNRDAFTDMTTDAAFGYPSDRQLKLQSRVAPSYQYIFGYRSVNASEGIFEDTEWAGVPHSGEIPYFWGWPLLQLSPEVRNNSKIYYDIVPWNDHEDVEFAEFTIDLITNFAKYFDPTPEPVQAPSGFDPVTWPALTEDELNYIWIHIDDVEPRINYRQKEMAFFRDYIAYIIGREIYSEDATFTDLGGIGLDASILEKATQKLVKKMVTDDLPSDFFESFDFYEDMS